MIVRCQPGFEALLERELATQGVHATAGGAGWVAAAPEMRLQELCFAQTTLLAPVEVSGESVNALAARMADYFFASAREERFEQPWPLLVEAAAGLDGLGRRSQSVGEALREQVRKKMARVGKLAVADSPKGPATARGLFVFFVDFGRAWVAREAIFGGQRRMADDPLAPSRSYLKIEEAYGILGREPQPGETVADLGAAPGGWSYSAAKRGARVIAVDNGPLKGGAADHPAIEHRREDAFRFQPAPGEMFDWMFCDLVEEPHHVMRNLVEPWITRGWCRRFVIILKFGRVDALKLLEEVMAPDGVLRTKTQAFRVRHLYHDREEFTVVGEVRA